MKYMILNYVEQNDFAGSGRDETEVDGSVWGAYTKALIDAGVLAGGDALHPSSSATTLRIRDGQRDIHDGPYADTKEQIGGFYIIEVSNLDEALEWAARNPAAATGAVEVRPIFSR